MKISLTKYEISEYNTYRSAIMHCITRAEVAYYTNKCRAILRRGERRYIERLEQQKN